MPAPRRQPGKHFRYRNAIIAAATAVAILVSVQLLWRSSSAPAQDSALPAGPAGTPALSPERETPMPKTDAAKYVGLWVTADNQVRQQLLPTGRYVEARGTREAAYTGRYEITGDHIEYWDDSGFQADGEFRDDVLYHGGMVMRRSTN